MKKFTTILYFIMFACAAAFAQVGMTSPVKVQVEQQAVKGHDDLLDLVFTFTINSGWHVYGPDNNGGPTPMAITLETLEGAQASGALRLSPTPTRIEDPVFECEVTYVERSAKAIQRLRLTGGTWKVAGFLRYGACNDEECMPPTNVEFSYEGRYEAKDSQATAQGVPQTTASPTTPEGDADVVPIESPTPSDSIATEAPSEAVEDASSGLWTPVIDELKAIDVASDTQSRSLWGIFFLGIVGGLIALLTPCVWPIIPMTVSFFLKRAKDDKQKGISDAILYGLSIVVIYVGLGLLVTLIWGPSSLNALSTNAIFNLFLFALLVVFAASFLGGFEITLPSSWSTKMDEKASSTTGLLSIFFMALTLVVVSFSCTGPIIGLLLVDMVTSGSVVAPTVGMLGFALALAAPFTLFAMFPTWLKSAPKSGNWMNEVPECGRPGLRLAPAGP